MNELQTKIFVIDDSSSVRNSISLFLKSHGYGVETFGSSEEFLAKGLYHGPGCIILDVRMEGKSGLDLQDELNEAKSHLPIIFITGFGNVQMSVKALKGGAINFLEKPFNDTELLKSISEALELSIKAVSEKEERMNVEKLVSSLTPRENEILKYMISGMLNKQIAYELGITEHTVKIHRQSICNKLNVKSIPDVIDIARKADILPVKNMYL